MTDEGIIPSKYYEEVASILGNCSCGPEYRDRGLASPHCAFCANGDDIYALLRERDAYKAVVDAARRFRAESGQRCENWTALCAALDALDAKGGGS